MTTASTIITDAYRECNLIPVGKSPTTDEQTEALRRLNRIIDSLFGFDLGEKLQDWTVPPARTSPVPARWDRAPLNEDLPSDVWPYPPPNSRLVTKITGSTTVYFPSAPDDGAQMSLADAGSTASITLDGNGRQIEGAATQTFDLTSVTERRWFYRADLAEWVLRSELSLTDQSPLPAEFDDFLTTCLAFRLSPRYGKTVPGETLSWYNDMRRKLKTRYAQVVQKSYGWSQRMTTEQTYGGIREW